MVSKCPINGDNHRYFISPAGTKVEFIPVTEEEYPDTATGGMYGQLYYRNETAILGCNCGSVIKSVVRDNSNV